MSGYIRSIRGIERSQHYAPISAVNRYAQFGRMRGLEEAGRMDGPRDSHYAAAAEGAADWLRLAKSGIDYLTGLQRELGGRGGIDNARIVEERMTELVHKLNEWRDTFRMRRAYLKEEVWEALELALRHPAVEALAIGRSAHGGFQREEGAGAANQEDTEAAAHDKARLSRLLLGADGLLNELKRALSYAEQHQVIDLLRMPFPAVYPYALYYGSMQTYWPLPHRGVILNKHI